MAKRIIKPNVVSGGVAIPLGNNFYYMKGRKHKNGGIDIGSNPKTGIEVEDGEVMQMMQNGAKVFSSMPFLRGSSPANKVLAGENPDNVFRQQELYKDRNNINDDGTKKKAAGGQIPPWKKQQNNTQPYSPTLNLNENQLYELQKGVLGENKANLKKTINDTKIVNKNKPTRKITDNQYNSRKNIIKDYNDQHEKEAYRSKKDMQFDYKVDNRDKNQVKWIADWYNGRRKQIYNNLYNYAQGYLDDVYMYRYNKNNNNFTREKDYFNRFMNKKNAIDKEYDRLLNNMSSANIDNSLLDDASYDVLGGYEPPFKAHKKNKYYGHIVGYRPDATKDVIVHERTHAANPNAQINAVNTIKSIDNKDYIKSAKEVYSRLMQYRYKHNLDPKTKIDDSYLNSHRKELYDLDLDFMNDEELKFLFNEVADNNKTNKIKPMAKFGGYKKYAGGREIPPYNTNNKSNMYSRMKDPNRKTIKDWKTGKVATHKLSYATVDDKTIVYPNIQEINGELYDFTDPKNNRGKWDSLRRAIDTGDTLQFNNEADADKFVNNYKKKFKGFDKYAGGGIAYRNATRNAFGDNYPYGIYPLSLDYMFPGDEVTSNEKRYANQLIPTMSYINKEGYTRYYPAINGFTKKNANEFDIHDSIGYLLKNNRTAQSLYRHRLYDAGIKPNIPDKLNPYEDRGIPYVNKNGNVEYLQPEEAKAIRYTINKDTNPTSSNKFSNFFKNKDNLSDTIGIGSNILGSTLSYFANKRMLNNMKEPIKPKIVSPVSYQATKLKTGVNINPQLDTLRNSSAIYNNSVDNNTASSRVALARKQANRMNINNQINNLYGNKENQETELINRDRLQQQQIANQNIAQYNDYLTRKAAIDNEYNNQLINFNNTINEKKGENLVSLFNNSNAAIQDILNRREQRNNERNTIAAYLASNPNVNPRLFTRLGIDGVFTPEMIQAWEEEYKNNKNKTKTN